MKFIIDITNATACFCKGVKAICVAEKYTCAPNNKKYYLVDTDSKTCNGIDSIIGGYEVLTESTSFPTLRKKFK